MNILTLQNGLLDFLWMEPSALKSFSTLNNICVKLYDQAFPDKNPKSAKYDILYPLIRIGVIEAYENGNFGLSPSFALVGEEKVAFINLACPSNNELEKSLIYETEIGIKLYEKSAYIMRFLKSEKLNHSFFSLRSELNKIQPFDSIITSWDDDLVIDTNGFLKFSNTYTWTTKFKREELGLYKKGAAAFTKKVVRIGLTKWKSLPLPSKNIDGFNIAVLYSQLKDEKALGIKYYSESNRIEISTPYFPMLIERLLFINSALHGVGVNNINTRNYFIDIKAFNSLNKLLNSKIQII